MSRAFVYDAVNVNKIVIVSSTKPLSYPYVQVSTGLILSNPKQPSCEKKSAALRKAMVKKDVKSKVAAKKWL